VKTEADFDCMILEHTDDDKLTVGMLLASLHSFICLLCFVIFFLIYSLG